MSHQNDLHAKPYLSDRSDFIPAYVKHSLILYKVHIDAEHSLNVLRVMKVSALDQLNPPIQSLSACRMFALELINDVIRKSSCSPSIAASQLE